MPVIQNQLGHEFTVTSINISNNIDTQINIIKRREEIVYRSNVPTSAANIGFVGGEDVSSENNLSVSDRSTSLPANRITQLNYTSISGTKTFNINTDNFVVTDVFTEQTNTINPLPLFYKHTINESLVPRDINGDLDTGVTLLEVSILDSMLQPVKIAQSKIDRTSGILYNNLLPEFNNVGDYVAYYVKFVVNNNGDINTYINLLDNRPVYRLADFEDLTPELTIKTDGRKVYLIEESVSEFTVTLPVIGDYSFQPLSSARIEILPPVSKTVEDSWFIRVTNGKFFTNVNGSLRKYHIAEFLSQTFAPQPPIKFIQSETSTILSESLIKLDNQNIYEDVDLSLHLNILIDNASGAGVAAFTTNPSIVNNIAPNGKPYQKWSATNRTGIKSIDHITGFLDIEGITLKSSYTITSSYYYNEDKYEFTLVNFNPISNSSILSSRISFFIDPDTAVTNKTQTLYYLRSDETGRVVESNWPDFDNDTQHYIPSGINLYYELFPTWKPAESHLLFTDVFTVEGNLSGDFLILGDVTVAPASHPNSLEQLDSRRRGGGILDTEVASLTQSNPEIQWCWDIGYWDGTPYPGNASYLVEVPVDILENAGGNFTQSQVRDIIERHTAAGVYPVARAYGVDISVSGVYPGGDNITIQWTSHEY